VFSDDRVGKLEGLAAKTVECGAEDTQVLLSVSDETGTNEIHSFVRVVPEPGVLAQLVAGALALLALRRRSPSC
jgi:hypothetical protein